MNTDADWFDCPLSWTEVRAVGIIGAFKASYCGFYLHIL